MTTLVDRILTLLGFRRPTTPDPAPATRPQVDPYGDPHLRAIRTAALAKAQHTATTADWRAIGSEFLCSWIKLHGRDGLFRIAVTTDRDLHQHIRGIRRVRGLVPADRDSVLALLAARAEDERRRAIAESGGRSGSSGGGPRREREMPPQSYDDALDGLEFEVASGPGRKRS